MFKLTSCCKAALAITLFLSICAHAAEAPKPTVRPLYIIFDGSNSMWGDLQTIQEKIAAAKDVFKKLDDAMFEGREVALRLYGHRRAKDCSDTELAVPFTSSSDAKATLSRAINAFRPVGKHL